MNHREESPLMRAARTADLDWDITTSVLVMFGLMFLVGIAVAGLVFVFDTLAAWIGR